MDVLDNVSIDKLSQNGKLIIEKNIFQPKKIAIDVQNDASTSANPLHGVMEKRSALYP